MNLEFYTPKNELLRELIEGYYFIIDNQIGGTEQYWTFPNNYCIVTTNLNSEIEILENNINILPSKKVNISSSIVYRYLSPIRIYYEKPINEITIYFKPLGLNHFATNPDTLFLQDRITKFLATLAYFETEMFEIFNEENRDRQLERLENFWLQNLNRKDLGLIESIVKDIESNMKIEEVAKKYNLSRKHLNTIFLKYLGKSPGEYQKIYRFRKAVVSNKESKNLTELAYENQFYDQSHLIKNFKALTNNNPKKFFRNVDSEQKNVWLFI